MFYQPIPDVILLRKLTVGIFMIEYRFDFAGYRENGSAGLGSV